MMEYSGKSIFGEFFLTYSVFPLANTIAKLNYTMKINISVMINKVRVRGRFFALQIEDLKRINTGLLKSCNCQFFISFIKYHVTKYRSNDISKFGSLDCPFVQNCKSESD